MNTSASALSPHYAISLYDNRLRTVGVVLGTGTNAKEYVYKTYLELQPGELVIAPVRTGQDRTIGFVVAKVTTVHDDVQIGRDDNYDFKWIVQSVDVRGSEAAAARDAAAIKAFRDYQRLIARTALAKEMEESAPGLGDAVRAALALETVEVESENVTEAKA